MAEVCMYNQPKFHSWCNKISNREGGAVIYVRESAIVRAIHFKSSPPIQDTDPQLRVFRFYPAANER